MKLILNNICHHFGDTKLLEGVSLSLVSGQVVAIVGTSGVGKSTLFNIVAGLICPQVGKVIIDGVDRTGQAGFAGYMLQKDLLLPFKRVYDNVALPLVLKNVAKDSIRQAVQTHSHAFGLANLLDKYPHQLSGGQRQRVALLRTYLNSDSLMLLDEPFSALDYVTKHQMYDWFRLFQIQKQLTCLLITHDIDEAMRLADNIYVLKGTPACFVQKFDVDKSAGFVDSMDYIHLKKAIIRQICA